MRGQWRGTFDGSNSGEVIVEFDDHGTHFEGCAYLYEADPSLPATFAFVRTPNRERQSKFQVALATLDPKTEFPVPFEAIAETYKDVEFPSTAEVTSLWDEENLKFEWTSNIGTNGVATLRRSRAAEPSECPILPITDWASFKRHLQSLEHGQLMFRGQSNQWRLRTAFHRTGRADLRRYLLKDIPALHRHLSAITRHPFQLDDPLQNAAFFNLVQHHGFPTPLLDWSYSPYVAAYFAYEGAQRVQTRENETVRIYLFNKVDWCANFPQIQNTNTRRPHFSILETLGIENNRMIPQQALSSFTNVDDIESYVLSCERDGFRYLSAIDLPLSERSSVMRELRMMGVTAGSLFPGLDGACKEFRERYFDSLAI